jgi:hypothetical protein
MFLKVKRVFYKAFLNILLITTFRCFAQAAIETPIQTEYNHYVFNIPTPLKIQTTFINLHNYFVYLPGCRGITKGIEKFVNGQWVYIYPRSHFACGTYPIPRVNPDEILTDIFVIKWDDLFFENPGFRVPGECRIVWQIYKANSDTNVEISGTLLTVEQRISNTFRIELP